MRQPFELSTIVLRPEGRLGFDWQKSPRRTEIDSVAPMAFLHQPKYAFGVARRSRCKLRQGNAAQPGDCVCNL